MLSDEQINEIFSLENETVRVEWKSAEPLDSKSYVSKLACAVMAMANNESGGFVVIGIRESEGHDRRRLSFEERLEGVNPEQLPEWNYDNLASKLGEYMQPMARFECHPVERYGKTFVILSVEEFEDQPIICTRDGTDVQRGALYVRGRAPIQSRPVQRYEEMRDLLDRAVVKGIRRFIAQIQQAGLALRGAASDLERFREEAERF